MKLGRDGTIEYLLSVCTGVVFCRKKVSSHSQQVRIKLGEKDKTAEWFSFRHGFEKDFPEEENSFGDELAWMEKFTKERLAKQKKTQAEALDANCPLVLPPMLAVILQPGQDGSKINWGSMNEPYLFSKWTIPDGLLQRYLIEQQAFNLQAKTGAAKRKGKQPQTSSVTPTATSLDNILEGPSLSQKGKGKKPVRPQGNKVSPQPFNRSSTSGSIVASPVEPVREVRSSSLSSSGGSSTREDLEAALTLHDMWLASGGSARFKARRDEALDRLRRLWGFQENI